MNLALIHPLGCNKHLDCFQIETVTNNLLLSVHTHAFMLSLGLEGYVSKPASKMWMFSFNR